MDTNASTPGGTTRRLTTISRKWVLVIVAMVIVAAIVMLPLLLSLSRSTELIALPSPPAARDMDGGPMTDASGESAYRMPTNQEEAPPAQPWDRMIIRTGTLQLTVKDMTDSIQRVRAAANASGGYVFSSETRNEGDYTYATITLYIPAANFDQVLPELRALGGQVEKVANETISSSDVTEEYTDLDSQLRNLKATEGRMLALQAKAERMEDILAIDRELRTIQSEIERIQGRMTYLGKRAEMSTLTVYLSPAIAPASQTGLQTDWQPLKAAEGAWNASLRMLAAAGTAIITAAVFLWWLVPVLAVLVWVVVRARRRTAAPQAEANAG